MRKRSLLFVIAALMALQTFACSSPWKVVRKADPNPFHKKTPFAVGSTYYRGLTVAGKPEDVYQQRLNDEEKKQWKAAKTFFSQDFRRSVKRAAAGLNVSPRVLPKSYVLNPNVVSVIPGNGKNNLKVTVRIRIEKKSSVFDLIELTVEVKPSEAPNFSRRFRVAARRAGIVAAKYLKERAK